MEKKVHFKLHKVKKHWVTIAVTGLALGLSFAGLSYASAEEQPTPVNEATVEAIIKEGAIDVEAPASNEATTKPVENTAATASSEVATVSETPVVTSEGASTETVSEKPSSEVTSTASSEAANSETTHSEVSATTSESVTTENSSPTTSDTDTPNSQVPSAENNITGGHYYSDKQGNWYYEDANGKKLTGDQTIDNVRVSFWEDGKQIKGPQIVNYKLYRYFDDNTGQLQTKRYLEYKGNWYYVDKDGIPLKGEQTIDRQEVYFDYDGTQVKGDFSEKYSGNLDKMHYYDPNTGARVRKEGLVQDKEGRTFFINNDGSKYTGTRMIDGNLYYFEINSGVMQKGISIELEDGKTLPTSNKYGTPTNITRRYYFDSETGQLVKKQTIKEHDKWYYYGDDGNAIRPKDGETLINGQIVYLYSNGRQAKGELVLDNGVLRYYDPDSGARVVNTSLTINGMTYNFDENGIGKDAPNPNGYYSDEQGNWYYKNASGENLIGSQIIKGQRVFFRDNGQQVKGAYLDIYNDLKGYYDINTGNLVTNRYVEVNGNWYYVNKYGSPLKGAYIIDGQDVMFDPHNGKQIKGGFVRDPKFISKYYYMPKYYYDKDNGCKVTHAGFVNENDSTYYLDDKGQIVLGLQEINGDFYYFRPENTYKHYDIGEMLRDRFIYENNKVYYVDHSGKILKNRFFERNGTGTWYYFTKDGTAATGEVEINGQKLYFDNPWGFQTKGRVAQNGKFYDKDSGELVTNTFKEVLTSVGSTINGEILYAKDWYYLDREGRPLKGPQTLDYVKMYFFPNGAQVKGRFAPDGHYYDKDTGALVTNRYVHIYNWKFQDKYGNPVDNFFIKYPHNFIFGLNDNTIPVDISHYPLSSKDFDCEDYFYYVDVNGDKVTGEQTIDNVPVYFHSNGKQAKGELVTVDGKIHYYDANSGARLSNIDITIRGQTYHFDADGNGTPIS